MKVEISAVEIATARSDADDEWSLGDDVLYRLCANYPRHRDVREVVAKLWLVGRAYSAAIERRQAANAPRVPTKTYYRRAAEALIASNIDARLSSLPAGGPTVPGDAVGILAAHHTVVGLIRSISHSDHRSFASKYLHFHRPEWFLMFDSIAARGLGRIAGRTRAVRGATAVGDTQYRNFAVRALALRSDLANAGHPLLSLRELDRLLLARGA